MAEITHFGLCAVPGPVANTLDASSGKNMVAPKIFMRLEDMAGPIVGRETF